LARSLRISFFIALVALATAASASAAGSGSYPAKLTVAGEVTVTTVHDFTGPCERNQAWTIESKASVNVSGKIDLGWIARGGLVQATAAKTPGGAANANKLTNYFETNFCPPEEPIPFEESDKPQCSSHKGTGFAGVGGSQNKIMVGISRKGGGEQSASCEGGFVNGPKPTGTVVGTLQSDVDEISLPLGVGVSAFKKLRVGQKLVRRVKLSGPCQQGTVAKASLFREDVCTVKGSFDVTVKRLPGKGRGGFTTG